MLKIFNLSFLLFFIFSCTNSIDENDIENIKLDSNDIIIDGENENSIIEQTTDEDIDELIDILFETNY